MFYSKLLKIKNNIHLSQLSLIGGGLALFMLSPSAAAVDCTLNNSPYTINTNFNLHRNLPINHAEQIAINTTDIDCDNTGINSHIDFEVTSNTPSIPSLPGVYPTNLRGIGIKYEIFEHYTNQCSKGTVYQMDNLTNTLNFNCNPNGKSSFSAGPDSFIYIVKLEENHEVGIINTFPIFRAKYSEASQNPTSGKTINNIFQLSNTLIIRRNGCTLDSNRLDFNLGKNQQNDFKRIGTTGTPITKQIPLTCDPDTKYFLQVDGVAEPNHPGVMKLTSDPGAATGVGVQLLANGQPVEFGRAKQMGTSAASGNNIKETIDITAQYYQTQNRVPPGPANASATFTMTYQ
ncbi:fimbrial protein [Yersinia massiliensis]|uniref:fimbrial protein n=1 Tax=Yersinia massiliensis TaxID=419257 RepID=UPI001F0FF6FB|nr:fimbrial protein [Yersinia massiliensis]MDA5549971.1 fimbrial protein [Yersinia massiliensis]UZM80244.1 fimbrial protein [Yersinia massiliensis]